MSSTILQSFVLFGGNSFGTVFALMICRKSLPPKDLGPGRARAARPNPLRGKDLGQMTEAG